MLGMLLGAILLVGVAFILLKIAAGLITLPFKIGFGLIKLLVGIVIGIPLLILLGAASIPLLIIGVVVVLLLAPIVLAAKIIF